MSTGAPIRPIPELIWHGINAAALLARAGRDGITVSGTSDAALAARDIAAQVLETVDDAAGE